MMKNTLTGIAVVAAAALALTSCSAGGGETGGGEAPAGAVPLSIGNFLDVTNWDPANADLGFDGPYLSAVYDALVTTDENGEPQPGIATQWEVSDDFLTVTFDIRTDAEFSDGTAVDADAVVTGLQHLKDGTTASEAYLNVAEIAKVDDDTIEFEMSKRDDTMLYFLGLGRSYLAAPSAIDAGTLSETPVGSGPYTLSDSSVPGSEYAFDKIEDHWDADAFPFDPLKITPLSDPTAMLNAMEAEQLNLIYTDKTGADLAEQNDWKVARGLATWAGLYFADRSGDMGSPLGDVKVRQALNYAFDREGIHQSIAQGEGFVSTQLFPTGTPGNVEALDAEYALDIEKAKSLLAEAGYADGFDVTMPMAGPFQPYQAIVEQTFAELGITVTWEETDFMSYMGKAPTYPMYVAVIAMDANPVATVERQISKPQWYNPNPGLAALDGVEEQVDAVFGADPGDAQLAEIEKLNELVTAQGYNAVFAQNENVFVSTSEFDVKPVIGLMFPTLRQISLS
ncbi:ABC transporter substrate-binding protein [Leucobacter sp.]